MASPGSVLASAFACINNHKLNPRAQVGTLCVVCKALFNLLADDMAAAAPGSSSGAPAPGLSQEDLAALAEVLSLVCAPDSWFMAQEEVPQVGPCCAWWGSWNVCWVVLWVVERGLSCLRQAWRS